VVTIAAIATAWCVDVNRRNTPRFLHVYLLRGSDGDEPVPIQSVKIRPNTRIAFGYVPENSFTGELEYKFGSRPSLQFRTYGCSFSGGIEFGKLMRAEVDPTLVDSVFVVTTEPDANLALNTANGE